MGGTVSTEGKLKFTYFPFKGRGFPTLLALEVGGVDYDAEVVQMQDWPAMKATGSCPFGYLALLTLPDGTKINETNACLLAAGNRGKLLGTSESEKSVSVMLACKSALVYDEFTQVQPTSFTVGDWNAEKAAALEKWASEKNKVYLDQFEKLCDKEGKFTKDGKTVGELSVFHLLYHFKCCGFLTEFRPKLDKFYARLMELDAVKKCCTNKTKMGELGDYVVPLPTTQSQSTTAAGNVGGIPKLTYFDGPGRAELARSAFRSGKVEFEDNRISQEAWPKLKGDASSAPAKAFGSMPVVTMGDYLVAQSIAVAQYASDMGRTPTAQERALDMMLLGAHAEAQTAMYACVFGDDESKAKGKEALTGKITPILQGIERQYSDVFLYQAKEAGPTLGDLAVHNLVESAFPGLKAFKFDLSAFQKINATVEAVEASFAGKDRVQAPSKVPDVSGKPELVYFAGPGRARLARLAFAAGSVEYTDTRLTFEQWPAVKQDPNSLPGKMFGSMPVIAHGKLNIAQSMAVAQYAADIGINVKMPPTNEQRGLDTMMLGAHAELQVAMYKCLFGDDEAKAKGMEALAGNVTPILEGIERQYKADGPYLYMTEAVGPSLGDLALLDVVTSPFPGLKALGFDVSPFKKVSACIEACQKCSLGTLVAALDAESAPAK